MEISRRQLLGGAAAVGATLAAPTMAHADQRGRPPRRVLRIAHMTDIHVQPELQAAVGFEQALEHAQSCKPDLIFLGGDMIMDALSVDKDRMRLQWSVFENVLKQNVSVPVESCLGNHDVWGWGDPTKYKTQSGFGKAYAMDALELSRPYRSFDQAGWHFIVLDSTYPKTRGYTGKLDDQQFEWLADDLAKTPADRPTLVMSHIPILSVAAYLDGDNERFGNWHVPGAWMHVDARRIKDLFRKHPKVKVCLSGHLHMVDRCHYLGVTYLCNGAVSGGWWKGAYQEFAPGYTVVDLFENGMHFAYPKQYGWNAAS